jgi:hypothetical protein
MENENLGNNVQPYLKENYDNLINTLLLNGEYCLNLCYPKKDLNEFRTCFVECESFKKKKIQSINHYYEQIEYLIQGKDIPSMNNQNDLDIDIENYNSGHLQNKYVFDDYYYQSSSTHDVGTPNTKSSVGSLFGRNK